MTMIENSKAGTSHPIETGQVTEPAAAGLIWEAVDGVDTMVWVGRVRGVFVGMVEARWQEGFSATTRLGRKLGTYGTLEDAQHAFIVKRPTR